MELATSIGDMSVLDEHGKSVKLSTLWQDGPCVLVFLRHFG